MKKVVIIIIVFSFVSGCVSNQQKENTLSFSGAFALYPMAIKWSEEYGKIHPDIRFNISAGGAGKGMADALAGTVDMGMFSREILPVEMEQGIWWVGLCKDAVLPTISAENPNLEALKKRGVKQDELVGIFIDKTITDWEQLLQGRGASEIQFRLTDHARRSGDFQDGIRVYTRSDACGAAGTWALFLGGVQEDLIGVGIHGDPGLADAVGKDPCGLGYNNTAYIYDIASGEKHPMVEVLPLDLNANGIIDPGEDFYETSDQLLEAISDKRYPSPPARELYLVARGKPGKQSALDFLEWVLTEGQQFVKEAGYVPIPQEKIDQYLMKLQEQ